MLRKIVLYCGDFWKKHLKGAGGCSKCPCASYQDALAGNNYCECGHSYGDHW